MDHFITCLEQNMEDPYGFKETLTWGNPESEECKEFPDLCQKYADVLPFPGRGDVCDHQDPITGNTRNACKMAVRYGAVVDAEKTWSWKCMDLQLSPIKDKDGNGMVGCIITHRLVLCVCQDDYCTSDPLYAEYAAYGRPDMFPPNYDAIMAIDHGDVRRVVTVPGYESDSGCSEDEDEEVSSSEEEQSKESVSSSEEKEESSSSHEEEEEHESSSEEEEKEYSTQFNYMYAKSPFRAQRLMNESPMNHGGGGVSPYVELVLTYLVIGIVCLGIGVCIGVTLTNNVATQKKVHNDF
eukprot:194328_1